MATACIKKVIKIGGSLAIILPTQWTKGKVEAGQEMVVVGNGELRIFPVHRKDNQPLLPGETKGAKEDQRDGK
jgi:antitoxin component of MazEF toxin-antitoxin module